MKTNNRHNIIFFIVLFFLISIVYLKNEYNESTIFFDKEKQLNIIEEYIKTQNTQKETWNNGAIKQIFELNEKNEKNGLALVFNVNGTLKEKGFFQNSILKELEKYNINGLIQEKFVCKDQKNCTQTTFKENGKILSIVEIIYNHSSKNSTPIFNGKYIQYHYDKDYITSITNYKDGIENGLRQTFRENGKTHSEVTYINGKREGKENIYNNDGTIFGEVFYENNIEIKK